MKRISIQLLTWTLLIAMLQGCKKDTAETPQNTSVMAGELIDYYIALEVTDNNIPVYRLFYFKNEEGILQIYSDGAGTRRSKPATVTDNVLTFDRNDNGSVVYAFKFSKSDAGEVQLTGVENTGTTAGTAQISYALLVNKADAPSFKDAVFTLSAFSNPYNTYYTFSKDGTKFGYGENQFIQATKGCYALESTIGFKDNDENLLGIFVPSWKGDSSIKFLLDNKNASSVATYKLYK